MTVANHPPFWSWFRNSLVVGLVTAVVSVFLCACAAYAFSRLRFKGRRAGMLALLLIQMFPNILAMVALYLLMIRIGDLFPRIGIGTYAGLILIYLGGALGVNTWLMKGFMDTIPKELDEAARVDGATHVQIFFKVILPLAAPVLAVIGLLSFITTQAEFLLADVIIGPNDETQQTLAVGLSRFVLGGVRQSLGAVRRRRADRGDPRRVAVPLPAALHRRRAHVRRRQGLTARRQRSPICAASSS